MPTRILSGRIAIGLLLVLGTVAVYAEVPGFDYIHLDDTAYVSENARVLAGPTREGIVWAFTTFSQANWHPLTWISLQIDAARGGGAPRAFHTTNVALHVLDTLLLFLLFERMTASRWRSALVAGLFALHPLHVESVAWIAERKDVLSTAFGLAALHAWVSYVRGGRGRAIALAVAAQAASLLAKPMFVSLPVLLLILEIWPLARRMSWRDRLIEKLPFVALSAASCLVTLFVQSHGGATRSLMQYPLAARAANAAVTTVAYLVKAVWPSGLAVFYPYPYEGIPAWKSLGAVLFVAAVTWLVLRLRARAPYLAFGWLWYLVTLLPVIGLVQVGSQAMADRYTYVPLIGPFAMLAWGIGDLVARAPARIAKLTGASFAAILLVLLGLATHRQAATWRDSFTLFEHAIAVTRDNAVAHNSLAAALLRRGDFQSGVEHCAEAVRIAPTMADAQSNLVRGLIALGRFDEARARVADELASQPKDSRTHVNVGLLAMMERRKDDAAASFREALRLNPEDQEAHLNLASILLSWGRKSEAVAHFEEAVRLRPNDARAVRALERARAAPGT